MRLSDRIIDEAASPNLATFPCNCGAIATEVINAASHYRRGWLCIDCGEFHKAFGRERLLERGQE